MLPNRFVPGQSSALRKSRLEGPPRPSFLPKPRRPGSIDRSSMDVRRPSGTSFRSSSAEAPRATIGGGRLSKEASATKLPLNRRSRSQQGENRYGQTTTPLHSNLFSRPTTTPVKTPTSDRSGRSWETSLERALAFVTVKDQRPISNVAWQRAECARVKEALAARDGGNGGGAMALIRPLTIARFVDITGALVSAITKDVTKLNTDNYITKLPHFCKRVLYPGVVSKSWLRTVNTLHAFPNALALLAYLLDLVSLIELPVLDERLYIGEDEMSTLRRDYLYKCWTRFNQLDCQYEDLNEEYLQNLRVLLGTDEEKIEELQQIVKKYEACLEDEQEKAARADEAQRVSRRDALQAALKTEKASRLADKTQIDLLGATAKELTEACRSLDNEIERANAESVQLRQEIETQPMSVAQRTRLLDDVDYAHRVLDSKRTLAEKLAKMVFSKETELALWQNKTLDSCIEYKQRLIHLSAQFPELASLAVDEKELMSSSCSERVSCAVSSLRSLAERLSARRAARLLERSGAERRRAHALEEARTAIVELNSLIEREQQQLEAEISREASESAAWTAEERELVKRAEELSSKKEEYDRIEAENEFWEAQDAKWQSKLSEMQAYIVKQREDTSRLLEVARNKRLKLLAEKMHLWNDKLVAN